MCCLVALGALGAAAVAEDAKKPDGGPSLEYRPPKPILPEPKGPTPAPPVTVFRDSFGGFGVGRGAFDKPIDVAFGDEERTYVLDAGNKRIQLFDRSKNFLLEWGDYGRDENRCQFDSPSMITVVRDTAGLIQEIPCLGRKDGREVWTQCEILLVADTGNDRFYWFKVPLKSEFLANLPCGHADSNFKTDNYRNGEVPLNGQYTYGVFGKKGIQDGRFDHPRDVQVASSSENEGVHLFMLILDAGNERVQACEMGPGDRPPYYDCSDFLSNRTGSRGDMKDLVSLATSREGAFDYLYTLSRGCSIQKFKFTMNVTKQSTVSRNLPVLDTAWPAVAPESGLCIPARVRYDSKKEYVYVLDSGNSMLSIFHRSGNFISALRGADRTFDEPRGFTFIPASGEFALADTGNDIVQKFTQR